MATRGQAGGLERHEYRKLAMGVEARVVLWAPSEAVARAAAAAAFARIDALEASWSDFRADSELSRLVARAGGAPVPVSEDLYRILARSRELSRASDGAFDVTIEPVVEVLRELGTLRLPRDLPRLRRALDRVDWRAVELDPASRSVRLARPGLRIDLGGIGKGAACTTALEELEGRGWTRALVELGGDLAAGDPPPGEAGWRVRAGPEGLGGSEVSEEGAGGVELRIAHRAVATSSTYAEVVSSTGEHWLAGLDPTAPDGLAPASGRIAYTVVARDGATADGLATIANVVGAERARTILAAVDPAAQLFVHPPPASDPATVPASEETDR